ncbi:MAG: acyltransferase [Usitatibacter sp.]
MPSNNDRPGAPEFRGEVATQPLPGVPPSSTLVIPRIESLEALRGFAAVYVFAGHLAVVRYGEHLSSGLKFGFRFGQEAVILFFLVSGFVVHLSTELHHDTRFRSYFRRRALRIYPIFLLAVLVSIALAPGGGASSHTSLDVLGNILMLQDRSYAKPGVWVSLVGGNAPLWSLSYEWWFYMAYFPMRSIAAPRQVHLVGAISLVGLATYWALPNQLSLFLLYFLIWWMGVEFAKAYLNSEIWSKSLRAGMAYGGLLTIMLALWALGYHASNLELPLGGHPVLEFRHYFACVVMSAVALIWRTRGWSVPRILRMFSIFAPISYGLYVLHYPIAITSTYLSWVPSVALQAALYVALAFLAAFLAEIPYQRAVKRAVSWVLGRRASAEA